MRDHQLFSACCSGPLVPAEACCDSVVAPASWWSLLSFLSGLQRLSVSRRRRRAPPEWRFGSYGKTSLTVERVDIDVRGVNGRPSEARKVPRRKAGNFRSLGIYPAVADFLRKKQSRTRSE